MSMKTCVFAFPSRLEMDNLANSSRGCRWVQPHFSLGFTLRVHDVHSRKFTYNYILFDVRYSGLSLDK